MSTQSVIVERVANSIDEFAILSTIVDRLTDDTKRLVYADWLEERGDARGRFLRQFVKAAKTGAELPTMKDVPAAWMDIVGLTIIEKIQQSGLRKWRDELLAVARPALRIEVKEANFDDPPPTPEDMGITRLGGDPDLPVGTAFPTAADGTPLHFLSQFNLADLQGTIAGRAFPDTGLISIFRIQVEGDCACYIDQVDFPRLVRFTPSGTRLARVPRPAEPKEPPAPFRPGLRLVETMRLPGEFYKWPNVSITYEQASALDDIFPTNLGGTAYILLGHATHGNIGEEPLKDRPDWVQLILVPYFEGPDYGITDMSLSYHLPAADLKVGRFDRLESTFG
jgi:uncharacterized protein (TIGR02996 family)